ncbi:MAG: aminoglycoside N(3)-acetyltransferase [Halanaeroarchaeum sp.]
MGERDAVERVDRPVTVASIVEDLRDVGVRPGSTLIVHSSLSAIGWVAGGAQAVVEALQRAVTAGGTVVVPTHSSQYTNPEHWENPPVPDEWIQRIRESMPAYRPEATPTRGVGAVPETFRSFPDVVRSRHPESSFAAWGAEADAVIADHVLDYGLGEGSPLAKIYERDGEVLLLGVGHGVNTSIHLAEYRADVDAGSYTNVVPVRRDGERTLVEIEDIETSTEDFPALGTAFERTVGARYGTVGVADATLLDQGSLVDFAVEWLEENR